MSGRHASPAGGGGPRLPANPAVAAGGAVLVAIVVAVSVILISHGSSAGAPAARAASSRPARAAAASSPVPSSPAPSVSGPPQLADPFGAQTAAFLHGRAGAVLAGVYDLSTRQTWTVGGPAAQDEASIVKLDILETLLFQRAGSGGSLSGSDQALAEQMIEDSDNNAATDLWDSVGGATGLRSYNHAAGLAQTTPSGCVQCPGFPWPGWGLTTTVPADQLALLRQVVEPSPLLSASAQSYVLHLMENVTPSQRWGISGGVPASVTVALKNGWLPLNSADTDWQVNSIGWVSGQGRNYLIAVVSTGNPTEQYGIDTINGLSALLWPRL